MITTFLTILLIAIMLYIARVFKTPDIDNMKEAGKMLSSIKPYGQRAYSVSVVSIVLIVTTLYTVITLISTSILNLLLSSSNIPTIELWIPITAVAIWVLVDATCRMKQILSLIKEGENNEPE